MNLDKAYWNKRYLEQDTGWDMRQASPPIIEYINQIKNKNCSILIPGCGSAYEAEYLLSNGFTNITLIDVSSVLVEKLQEKFKQNKYIKIICADFFEHNNNYDLIIEQTLFCAIHPSLRNKYAEHIHHILNPNGKLIGVLFNTIFDKEGPPFGGTKKEYENIFGKFFNINILEPCYNSISKRLGTELFINFQKK